MRICLQTKAQLDIQDIVHFSFIYNYIISLCVEKIKLKQCFFDFTNDLF